MKRGKEEGWDGGNSKQRWRMRLEELLETHLRLFSRSPALGQGLAASAVPGALAADLKHLMLLTCLYGSFCPRRRPGKRWSSISVRQSWM